MWGWYVDMIVCRNHHRHSRVSSYAKVCQKSIVYPFCDVRHIFLSFCEMYQPPQRYGRSSERVQAPAVLAKKFYRNLVYLRLFGGDLGRFNLGLGKSDSHKSTFVLQNDDYELTIETLTSTMRLVLMSQTRTASAYTRALYTVAS